MKRKPSAPRNPYVAVALFKKAGTHGKSEKAVRRAETVMLRRVVQMEEHLAFTQDVESSNLSAPTSCANKQVGLNKEPACLLVRQPE